MRFSFCSVVLGGLALAAPAHAASFDCGKAHAPDEHAVCASRSLSELDVEMGVRFEMLSGLVAMGTRGDMGDAQRVFLAERRACGSDTRCLAPLYRRRIAVLKSQYQDLKQRGPF